MSLERSCLYEALEYSSFGIQFLINLRSMVNGRLAKESRLCQEKRGVMILTTFLDFESGI